MRKVSVLAMIGILCISFLALAGGVQTSGLSSNALVNGDFETGTLDGWDVQGDCSVINWSWATHNGSFSALISTLWYTPVHDSSIDQVVYENVHLYVNSSIRMSGWIFPRAVGSLGNALYPFSSLFLRFYNESSMQPKFILYYTWCSNIVNGNLTLGSDGTLSGGFRLFSWNAYRWNLLQRNVTDDFYAVFGENDSNIVLHDVFFWYHRSNGDPGAFYADDFDIHSGPITWVVDDNGPANFSTIQEAINSARDGDTIFVRNGTYSAISVDKSLTLEGESKYGTIIEGGSEPYGSGMLILASNVRISNFTIQHARGPPMRVHGLEGPSYDNITISDNVMIGNGEGLRLINTTGNLITGNVIRDASRGIGFDYASGSIVRNNTLMNVSWGIHGGYPSYNNTFLENTIIGNGIAVEMNSIFENNKFLHNNFINNTIQVDLTGGANSWDNGYEGNYWSDYTIKYPNATQVNNTGIWDTPYVIDDNNTDRFPLMNMYWSPGDINHDLKIDIRDVSAAAKAFGTVSGDLLWNPHADIAGPSGQPDGKIDIRDVSLVAKHFGEHYP